MTRCISMSSSPYALAEFRDAAALRAFYSRFGCDGIELILCGEDFGGKLLPGMVKGLHLIFYPEWIALWQNDFAYLDEEFGSRAAWREFYLAESGEGLLEIYRRELAAAAALGAEYVVFHIGDNPLEEYFTLRPRRGAKEVIAESAGFLNALFERSSHTLTLLLENMWLGSMNLTNPDHTRLMLESVRYPRTGLMLDTGHLMITNPRLRGEDEACDYIHSVLDAHGDLAKRILGVHLHRSLSGPYFLASTGRRPNLSGSYVSRYIQAGDHLRRVDPHDPFTSGRLPALISRISPRYLVYELSHGTLKDWEARLSEQCSVFSSE